MAAPDMMPDEEAPLFAEGDLVGGRYVLVRELGAGAAGQVWEAEHRLLTSRLAIKFLVTAARLEPESADILVQRFRFEAQISARLGNLTQHIVAAQDAGMYRGVPYLVMELVAGQNLDARIDIGPMSVEETANLLEQLAEPIDGAHTHGIAHRDVKPANIMVVNAHSGPFYKLGDFGTAKFFGEGLVGLSPPKQTSENTLLGSPAYMSPEYVSGAPIVSGHIDLWALSVTAYEALTRQLPFDGELWTHVAMALLKGDFKSPSQIAPGLPIALDAVFKRAFAQKPEDRFQTAREFASAFRAALRETAAPAPPPPPQVELADSHGTPAPVAGPISLEAWLPPALAKRPTAWLWGAAAAGVLSIGFFAWLAGRGPGSSQSNSSPGDSAVASAVTASAAPVQSATLAAPPPRATASEQPAASVKVKRPVAPKPTTKAPLPFSSTLPGARNESETH